MSGLWLFAALAIGHKRSLRGIASWRVTLFRIADVLDTSTFPFDFPPSDGR